ncbi:MAG: patatin-like phospholipase family protein [Candidatus Omnitrophica bacterium]|nr:patatin-like phospholipase family protein [Candidatus Omnitrophota bacterium]
MKTGLALGGGVALGFYHVGLIKALEKLEIKIDVISGTSIGSVIGGLYALTNDAAEVESRLFGILDKHQKELALLKTSFSPANVEAKTAFFEKWFDLAKEFYIWNLRIAKSSLVDLKPFLKIFRGLFEDKSFKDCKIPFYATAVNLLNADSLCVNKGPLYRAALASSSYPGFFPPLKIENKILIDGGVLMPVPAKIIRDKADFIIGVNLEGTGYRFPIVRNAMDVMNLADRIRYKRIIEDSLAGIDFLISPNLEKFSWGDFTIARELMQKGESEVLASGKELKAALKANRYKSFLPFKKIFNFRLPFKH